MTSQKQNTIEEALLGLIIVHPAIFSVVRSYHIVSDCFLEKNNQAVFKVLTELDSIQKEINEVIVVERLKETASGLFTEYSPSEYISSLIKAPGVYGAPDSTAKVFAESLNNIYQERKFKKILADNLEIKGKKKDIQSLVENTQSALFDIQKKLSDNQANKRHNCRDILKTIFTEVEQASNKDKQPFISTGFTSLDNMLSGGLIPGEYYVLGGRPSTGKTSLAINIGYRVSMAGKKVMILSLESSVNSIFRDRIIPAVTRIESRKLRSGNLDSEEWDSLSEHVSSLSALDNLVCYDESISISQVEMLVTREAMEYGVDLLLVDYIQKIIPDKTARSFNRNDDIGNISTRVHSLAKKYNFALLALSQLNRDCEKLKRPPNKADLRDSGNLEQDADVIMLLHASDEDEKNGNVRVIFDKNRNGSTGESYLRFNRKYTSFND